MSSLLNLNIPGFENFDQPDVVQKFKASALQKDSLNFALCFDDKSASGLLNLSLDSLTKLLANKVNYLSGCFFP